MLQLNKIDHAMSNDQFIQDTSLDISWYFPRRSCSRFALMLASKALCPQSSLLWMNSSKRSHRSWWLALPPQSKHHQFKPYKRYCNTETSNIHSCSTCQTTWGIYWSLDTFRLNLSPAFSNFRWAFLTWAPEKLVIIYLCYFLGSIPKKHVTENNK